MNAGQDETMIDIHERALNSIGETLITLQDETAKRMSDALEAAERTAAELREQLATAQARITELESYIDKHNQRVLSAFERTTPLDWRESEQETPYGQMLDGLGDEAEP